jgi:hypothetical protein
MDASAIAEIVNTSKDIVLPVLAGAGAFFGAKSNAAKSIVAHLSAAWWTRSLRRAGVSDEEIQAFLAEAARKDLSR